MKRTVLIKYVFIAVVALAAGAEHAVAQKYPERRIIRQGNRDYLKGQWVDSEVEYRRALEKDPESYEARFNLGNALYKQERFEEADGIYTSLGADSLRKDESALSLYNSGNSLFSQGKLQEALEKYKESLRRNPTDTEAKFNYAYVKKMLDDQKNDQDQDQNKDKNQDQDKDQDKDQNQQQQNQNQDPNQDPDKDDQGENDPQQGDQPPPQGNQPQESSMSKEQAERMLEAIQGNEDRTREKMEEKKAAVGAASGKNW